MITGMVVGFLCACVLSYLVFRLWLRRMGGNVLSEAAALLKRMSVAQGWKADTLETGKFVAFDFGAARLYLRAVDDGILVEVEQGGKVALVQTVVGIYLARKVG